MYRNMVFRGVGPNPTLVRFFTLVGGVVSLGGSVVKTESYVGLAWNRVYSFANQ